MLLKQHDHFIFEDTGEALEFYDAKIEDIRLHVENLFNVDISHYSLTFYGNSKRK